MTTETPATSPDDPAIAAWDAIEWDAMPERVRLQVMRAQVAEARLFAESLKCMAEMAQALLRAGSRTWISQVGSDRTMQAMVAAQVRAFTLQHTGSRA